MSSKNGPSYNKPVKERHGMCLRGGRPCYGSLNLSDTVAEKLPAEYGQETEGLPSTQPRSWTVKTSPQSRGQNIQALMITSPQVTEGQSLQQNEN